jgi:hypothetical protein
LETKENKKFFIVYGQIQLEDGLTDKYYAFRSSEMPRESFSQSAWQVKLDGINSFLNVDEMLVVAKIRQTKPVEYKKYIDENGIEYKTVGELYHNLVDGVYKSWDTFITPKLLEKYRELGL